MPACNAGMFIREAIQSVLYQYHKDFELIIVDDGSTDSTREIVRSFKDERIVLVGNRHDFINSLNTGLMMAGGRYIARMDADDLMQPERLQVQCDFLDVHHEVDLVASGMQVFGTQNYVYVPAEGRVTMDDLLKANRIAHPTVMMRRESLDKMSEWYRPEYVYAEDYDLWLRMCKAGLVLWNMPQVLLLYRTGTNQVTAVRSREMAETVGRIKRHYAPALTVIIPFLNEGREVELTVRNLREMCTEPVEIILINDSSTDGYDYAGVARQYACRYVEHTERKGVAASRDEGVSLSETPYFILLDAHMEFYEQGWDGRLVQVLQDNPRSLVCLRTRVLHECRENRSEEVAPVYGAVLSMDEADILSCKWNYVDPDSDAAIVRIEAPYGGAYACSGEYWKHLGGLHGLIKYGLDEEMISLKIRRDGGQCLLIKDMVAGHIYRSRFPYEVTNEFTLYNRIFIAKTLLDGDRQAVVLERLKGRYPEIFDAVYEKVCGKK
jgi:glycosyltransferase involved in cell wall biosynthesis